MKDLKSSEERLELVVGGFGTETRRDESLGDFVEGEQVRSTSALQTTLGLTEFCEAHTPSGSLLHVVAKFIFAVQKVPHSLPKFVQLIA